MRSFFGLFYLYFYGKWQGKDDDISAIYQPWKQIGIYREYEFFHDFRFEIYHVKCTWFVK